MLLQLLQFYLESMIPSITITNMYTCQLFLRYKREIFILGLLGFLKTTQSFPKIPEEVRSLPKTSEVCRSLPKASSLPVLFTSKIRDREEGIVIYSFYTWFSFLTWVWVNFFLEIVSNKTATTHIFQSGVRKWPASVSRREIEVFNPQAWESRRRRVGWYKYGTFYMCWLLYFLTRLKFSSLVIKHEVECSWNLTAQKMQPYLVKSLLIHQFYSRDTVHNALISVLTKISEQLHHLLRPPFWICSSVRGLV